MRLYFRCVSGRQLRSFGCLKVYNLAKVAPEADLNKDPEAPLQATTIRQGYVADDGGVEWQLDHDDDFILFYFVISNLFDTFLSL